MSPLQGYEPLNTTIPGALPRAVLYDPVGVKIGYWKSNIVGNNLFETQLKTFLLPPWGDHRGVNVIQQITTQPESILTQMPSPTSPQLP